MFVYWSIIIIYKRNVAGFIRMRHHADALNVLHVKTAARRDRGELTPVYIKNNFHVCSLCHVLWSVFHTILFKH